VPVQSAAFSHTPDAGLHSVPDGFIVFAGQVADVPVHSAAFSHVPDALLHTVPDGDNTAAWQVPVALHTGAAAHVPGAAPQLVLAGRGDHAVVLFVASQYWHGFDGCDAP